METDREQAVKTVPTPDTLTTAVSDGEDVVRKQ